MIGCFPAPYQDELFYSICARYAGRVQYRRKAAVMQELFGSGEGKGAIDLPTHLDFLVAALPPEHPYTADRFIDEHTLLPYYCPFLPPERQIQLRDEMRGNNAAGIYFLFGLRKGPIRPARHLRYCPQCATEDRARWGETYWHRIAQIPGVLICPKHAISFEETGVEALARRAAAPEFFAAERIIPKQESISALNSEPWHPILLELACDAAWLLQQRNLTPGFQRIYQRYLTLLAENQFAPPRGKIRLRELIERFQVYYPDALLDKLQCSLNPMHHHWLLGIVHGDHIGQHPLHHLLLMQLLGSSAEEFFRLPVEMPPFGVGPWPCLNPASDHYRERVIEDCQITSYGKSHRLLLGTFTCACGFIYWRRGPDQGPEDQYHYEGITAYGPIWEEALRTLVERHDLDQQAIARHLETSDAAVGDQAARLGLKRSSSPPQPRLVGEAVPPLPQVEQSAEGATRDHYRAVWLAAMQDGQTAWAKDLREKEPKAYSWLYWHDREWLKGHMPPRKPCGPHVDWPTRDQQLAQQIRAAAERIKNRPGRPVRVTQNALSRELGQSTLRANFYAKQQLPLASQALDEVLETSAACAVRKIWWAASCFAQEHIKPGRWDLLKRSGVRRQEASPAVQQAIDAALRTCSSLTEAKAG